MKKILLFVGCVFFFVIHSSITGSILKLLTEKTIGNLGFGTYFFLGAVIHFFTYYLIVEVPFLKKSK